MKLLLLSSKRRAYKRADTQMAAFNGLFALQNAHLLLYLSYKHIRPKDLGFCPPRMDYFLSSKRTFGRSKNEEQFLQNYYSLDPTAVAGSDRDV